MTIENTRLAIKEELRMAEEFARAAVLLAENQMFGNAVSRLYYQAFHYIKALLLTKSLEPKTHEGMLRLFGLYFVNSGTFSVKESRTLGRLMKYREEADYDPVSSFALEDYNELRESAASLTDHVRTVLRSQNYIA